MRVKHWLTGLAAAAALGLMAASAQAVPAGSVGSGVKAAAGENGAVEKVDHRRHCWWAYGRWHCRHHYRYYRYYDEPYYYYGPSYYYYGPSFRFGHRHHHHRHW